MLFADLVVAVRQTLRAEQRKMQVEILSDLFGSAGADIGRVVAWLSGERRRELDRLTEIELPDSPPESTPAVLALAEIDRSLSSAAAISADTDAAAVGRALAATRSRATPDEWAFVRDTLRSPAPWVDVGIVISAIAKAARARVGDVRRAAATAGSLATAAQIALTEGTDGLKSVEVQVGRRVEPMHATSVVDAIEGIDEVAEFVLEAEIPGVRIQVHRRDGTITVFDDDLVDVTSARPEIADALDDVSGGDVILDGVADGAVVRFFDVLFVDVPVIDEPLESRRRRLAAMVPHQALVPVFRAVTAAEIEQVGATIGRQGWPGVMIKDLAAAYEPGHRSRSWRRLAHVEILDLVVVAAEWGSGRRAGFLSTVHMGARSDGGAFERVGSTALGVSDEVLAWQTKRFTELALDPVSDERKGLIRVRPEQVVEVAVSGANPSERYESGYSFDAVRIRRYRHDVDVGAAASVAEIAELVESRIRAAPMRLTVTDTSSLPTLPVRSPDPASGDDRAAQHGLANIRGDTSDISPPDALTAVGSGKQHPPRGIDIDFDFPPYEPPSLDRSRAPHRAVLVARLVFVSWAMVTVGAAIIARESAAGGPIDGSTVTSIGRFVFVVVTLLALTGWWWTDQRTRNLKRLDGRRPGRLRSVSAWLASLAGIAVLVSAIIPVRPTMLLDVQPLIVALLFPILMWRPYSLVRRIFATLIRVRFDALVIVAYLCDVVSFGLIWWWSSVWPAGSDPASPNEVDALTGIGLAVCLTTATSAVVWYLLIRGGDAAEGHREVSQQTRYEHRMLRLRRADPTDPAVWWALVQRRAAEQSELDAAAAVGDRPSTVDPRQVPSVEVLLENVRHRNGVALRRLSADDSSELMRRIRTQFATVASDLLAHQRRSAGPGDAASSGSDGQPTDVEAGVPPRRSRMARFREQFVIEPLVDEGSSPMFRLLDHAGSMQVEAALADQNRRILEARSDERMLPPTLYPIEAARFALLGSLAAAAVAASWLVTRTLSAGSDQVTRPAELAAGIDQARTVVVATLSVALSLIPLWTFTAAHYAQRCEVENTEQRRHLALFALAALACGLGFVIDGTGRVSTSSVLLILIAACASLAGLWTVPTRRWFALRSVTVLVWSALVPLVVTSWWLGKLYGPTESIDGLRSLTLAAVLVAVGIGLVLVLLALSTDDYHDELRLSPELQVPAAGRRRRR